MLAVIELLRGADLLAGLTDDLLEEIASSMERITYGTGDIVFNKGEHGDAVYLVEEGKLRLESDGVPFLVCDEGEWVGEVALIDSGPRSATAVAHTELSLLRWGRENFHAMVSKRPDVAVGILRILAAKLRSSTDVQVDLILEQERITQDLKRAREIQMGMLPSGDMKQPELELSGYCRPAAEVGDVTGHGFYAGLFVAMAKSCLNTQVRLDYEPSMVMQAMGRTLHIAIQRSLLMTCCYVVFDPASANLRYSNAGHIHPYHFRKRSGGLERLEAEDPLLGVQDLYGWEFTERCRGWEPGDVLVMYSDGLTEARNLEGEMFDHPRLEECILAHSGKSAAEIKEAVIAALADHCGPASYGDDVTVVVARAL
jgi:CRP-like cAMP-binding protein